MGNNRIVYIVRIRIRHPCSCGRSRVEKGIGDWVLNEAIVSRPLRQPKTWVYRQGFRAVRMPLEFLRRALDLSARWSRYLTAEQVEDPGIRMARILTPETHRPPGLKAEGTQGVYKR